MSMAGGMSSFNENSTFPDLLFHAEADISNPNLLGGTADSGHFQVFFQGQEIGTATSEPCSVKPQSSGIVAANSTVRLHYHSFQALTTHVLMNELKLTVQVKGGAWVQGPLGIRIKVGLECQLHCAVEKLFDYEARHEVVQSFQDMGYFPRETFRDGRVRRLSRLMDTLSPGFAKALLHARDAHMTQLLRSNTFASDRIVPGRHRSREAQGWRLHDMYRGWGQLHVEYSSPRSSLTEGDWPHAPFYDPKVDTISRLAYWLELAEHFRFPEIRHFASLPEMIHLVLHTSWAEVSIQTRAHHRRVVLNSEEILVFDMIGVQLDTTFFK
eukprot:s20_g4.t1